MPEPRILAPRLPAATRVRLRLLHQIDGLGGWLCAHHGTRAAELLWRACRML